MKAVCIRLTKSTWKTEDTDIENLKQEIADLLTSNGYSSSDLDLWVKDIPR
jgi:hypothetical protein